LSKRNPDEPEKGTEKLYRSGGGISRKREKDYAKIVRQFAGGHHRERSLTGVAESGTTHGEVRFPFRRKRADDALPTRGGEKKKWHSDDSLHIEREGGDEQRERTKRKRAT